jgi:hypothetical protein
MNIRSGDDERLSPEIAQQLLEEMNASENKVPSRERAARNGKLYRGRKLASGGRFLCGLTVSALAGLLL